VISLSSGREGFDFIFSKDPLFFYLEFFELRKSDQLRLVEFKPELASFPLAPYNSANAYQLPFFDDLEVKSPLELHSGSTEDDPDRASRSALFPDDFS